MNTNSSTTNSDWLALATKELKLQNIPSARLDALLILGKILGLSRLDLISERNIFIKNSQLKKLNKLLIRRLNGEPMAYIRETQEFYGRSFYVNKNVLIPRPESESFIELVKMLRPAEAKVADIGCGTGCLGITVKLELPFLTVDLYDKSIAATEIAKMNAKRLNAKLSIKKSDLLSKLSDTYNIFLVNLPYLPNEMKHSNNLKYEPILALFAGEDGMGTYRSFWQQVNELSDKPSYILCEALIFQHNAMKLLAQQNGYRLMQTNGLVQLFAS